MTDAALLGEAVLECSFPIVVTRFTQTPVIRGRKQSSPAFRQFECQASVQPLSGKELQQLSEGQRNEGRVKAYMVEELKTVDTSDCRQPDRFEYRGVTYEVIKVDDWMDAGGYFRVEAARVNP